MRKRRGAHYYLARLANHRGEYTDALKDFQLAVQAGPNWPESYAEMGALYIKLKD